MDESKRERLLKRINRQSSTIGAKTPDTITVNGEELDLQEFLIETRRVEGIPEDAKELVLETKRALKAERKELVGRLETEEMSYEEGKELADTIVGIDRALNALDSLRGRRYGERSRAVNVNDHKQWLDFLESVSG
ncbi:DUF5788 family protein [Natranaeroarchaeum sulfidigenes]|uniref:Uncharacterized protein n=1 Tax=Natranaeroarchaeum sulfidigenes TaxID=2784880 RepID=A0A897MNR8_9EURY|nr:DUF5788 family protein [Natranaeroarchaeum sulfidigenes]QSG01578.1 Uncharacterized protein AArcS_0348 [Natranaeroarchaeum sulfidigenes]